MVHLPPYSHSLFFIMSISRRTLNSSIGCIRGAQCHSQFPTDPDLDGSIDDFRIYDRALSPSEIKPLAAGS
jgi:hypothetical protein